MLVSRLIMLILVPKRAGSSNNLELVKKKQLTFFENKKLKFKFDALLVNFEKNIKQMKWCKSSFLSSVSFFHLISHHF